MEEKQKEGMPSLRLIVSISTTFAIVGKLPRFSYPVESQWHKGGFSTYLPSDEFLS